MGLLGEAFIRPLLRPSKYGNLSRILVLFLRNQMNL